MRDIVEGSGVGYLSCRIEVCRSTRAQSCYEHNHPELEARLRSRAEAEGLSVEAYVERIGRQASSLMQIFPRPRAIANLHNSALNRFVQIGPRLPDTAFPVNQGRQIYAHHPIHCRTTLECDFTYLQQK